MAQVPYEVTLEHVGERREFAMEFGYPEMVDDGAVPLGLEYLWEDGNNACDCNRLVMGGWRDDDDKLRCSRGQVKARVTCRGAVIIDELDS